MLIFCVTGVVNSSEMLDAALTTAPGATARVKVPLPEAHFIVVELSIVKFEMSMLAELPEILPVFETLPVVKVTTPLGLPVVKEIEAVAEEP